jgi:hypothetical protein
MYTAVSGASVPSILQFHIAMMLVLLREKNKKIGNSKDLFSTPSFVKIHQLFQK